MAQQHSPAVVVVVALVVTVQLKCIFINENGKKGDQAKPSWALIITYYYNTYLLVQILFYLKRQVSTTVCNKERTTAAYSV